MCSCETIGNVKSMVRDMVDVPPHCTILQLYDTPLKDNRTLADYNIQDGASLHIFNAAVMFVKLLRGKPGKRLMGKTITFEIKPSDTINDVKAKIQKLEGISPEEQRLDFAGTQLGAGPLSKDGRRSLAVYNISIDCILYVILR